MRYFSLKFPFTSWSIILELYYMQSEVKVAQSCLTLCEPMDCSLPGSSVRGILQTRILEWAAMPFSRGSSRLRNRIQVSLIAGWFLPFELPRKSLVTKSHPTLCDPIDYSLPGSSVHGSLQARKLEWVAIPFSWGSFPPRDPTQDCCMAGRFFTSELPKKPGQSDQGLKSQ